jgi:hypothetical protein
VLHGLPSSLHSVPVGFTLSVGQVVAVPVQVSSRSHSSAAARQIVPLLPAGCGQVAPFPLHSSTVQGLLSLVQAVPSVLKASEGQAVVVPVQLSAVSHSPVAGRQTVPALPAGC